MCTLYFSWFSSWKCFLKWTKFLIIFRRFFRRVEHEHIDNFENYLLRTYFSVPFWVSWMPLSSLSVASGSHQLYNHVSFDMHPSVQQSHRVVDHPLFRLHALCFAWLCSGVVEASCPLCARKRMGPVELNMKFDIGNLSDNCFSRKPWATLFS